IAHRITYRCRSTGGCGHIKYAPSTGLWIDCQFVDVVVLTAVDNTGDLSEIAHRVAYRCWSSGGRGHVEMIPLIRQVDFVNVVVLAAIHHTAGVAHIAHGVALGENPSWRK